jgi:hypothetical protein
MMSSSGPDCSKIKPNLTCAWLKCRRIGNGSNNQKKETVVLMDLTSTDSSVLENLAANSGEIRDRAGQQDHLDLFGDLLLA